MLLCVCVWCSILFIFYFLKLRQTSLSSSFNSIFSKICVPYNIYYSIYTIVYIPYTDALVYMYMCGNNGIIYTHTSIIHGTGYFYQSILYNSIWYIYGYTIIIIDNAFFHIIESNFSGEVRNLLVLLKSRHARGELCEPVTFHQTGAPSHGRRAWLSPSSMRNGNHGEYLSFTA